MTFAQRLISTCDVAAQPRQRPQPVVFDFEEVEPHRRTEIGQREDVFRLLLRRVGVPQKERIDDARVVGHEPLEVEDARIVLRGAHADVVQRRRIAEVILRGVGVGVEHAVAREQFARLFRRVMKQVVEIGIDAQQQFVRRLRNHSEQHLLALGQVFARRNGDFETQIGVGEAVEDAPPEGDVLVPLDEHPHQPLRRMDGQRLRQLFAPGTERIQPPQLINEFSAHTVAKDNILLLLHKTKPPEKTFGSEIEDKPATVSDKTGEGKAEGRRIPPVEERVPRRTTMTRPEPRKRTDATRPIRH